MSNYEAVKPLNKTEYLVNCWSKRHLRVTELYHPHSPQNINIKKCWCQGQWAFKGKPFCYVAWDSSLMQRKASLTGPTNCVRRMWG